MNKDVGREVDVEALLVEARTAAEASYSPYSKFAVGAAVLCGDGSIVRGANIENASYGLTICAERSALFGAYSLGKRGMRAIAVTCPGADPALGVRGVMPCGACRQVIAELMDADGVILVDGVGSFGVEDLLPLGFALGA